MGKKGAKGRGKPVVMTPAEFFQSQGGGPVPPPKENIIGSEWERFSLQSDIKPKTKIVYAREEVEEVKVQEPVKHESPRVEPTPKEEAKNDAA